ncbi:addiction module protein [Maricurvus nonylphenolicus]|uniref:addiction module protein n=1 Tax=Maricurvus nonylphenolicus TaxID=1008307 RepID=UPI0036F2AC81
MKIQELSNAEKVSLAQELWDSVIIDQQALPVTQEQIEELDHRLAQFDMDEDSGASWQEVKARILKT